MSGSGKVEVEVERWKWKGKSKTPLYSEFVQKGSSSQRSVSLFRHMLDHLLASSRDSGHLKIEKLVIRSLTHYWARGAGKFFCLNVKVSWITIHNCTSLRDSSTHCHSFIDWNWNPLLALTIIMHMFPTCVFIRTISNHTTVDRNGRRTFLYSGN